MDWQKAGYYQDYFLWMGLNQGFQNDNSLTFDSSVIGSGFHGSKRVNNAVYKGVISVKYSESKNS